ncbi:MAG: response regulator transcription factor [Prevotellaceae bacterium]|jgi:DNA-binding NarL/FixJ family response regulator|nr:response regulator transcription factor [Prevotellaceae bacterium]
MRCFILADNQDITRQGIRSLLEQLRLTDTIVEASSCAALTGQLAVYSDAVVWLDYTLFDFSDVQMMNMRQRYPQSLWLLFSDELSRHFLRQVLLSGPSFGVVMKGDSRDDIIAALRKASRGEVYLCDAAVQVIREGVPTQGEYAGLTASERLVLHEIAMGRTTKEIAYAQNLSFHTINTHRRNIFRKLEINNVHEATKYALRAGIVDLTEYYI